MSFVCFLLFAVIGFIMFILGVAADSDVGLATAIFLLVCGFWASYEIRMIGIFIFYFFTFYFFTRDFVDLFGLLLSVFFFEISASVT